MSSVSESSSNQSSDVEKPEETSIPFIMQRGAMNPEIGLGSFYLQMLSSDVISLPDKYPQILLELKDEDQLDCLMRMKQLHHENILVVQFFEKSGDGCLRVYVEPYTGFVSELFENVDFFVNKKTGLVPSQPFQEIVSASLNVLDWIIKNDSYHGIFSWYTTVYHKGEKDGKITLKLCNFENRKNKSLLQCKIGDCHALAHSLEKVSRRVQEEYVGFKPETCCLIDDLTRRLRSVDNMESLSTMKEKNQDCVFFWDDWRKRTFCANEMPAAWFRQSFLASFQDSLSAPTMPWNTSWKSHKLMVAMEKYRVKNNILPYRFDNLNDFLRFISGLYTHEIELEVPHPDVDAAVHLMHPRLLLDLKKAVDN